MTQDKTPKGEAPGELKAIQDLHAAVLQGAPASVLAPLTARLREMGHPEESIRGICTAALLKATRLGSGVLA